MHILVDTTPDFREQALAHGIKRVDAVLFTHAHADHMFGFDDIRRFNTIQNEIIPAYATESTLVTLRRVFDYIGTEKLPGLYRPLIDFRTINGTFRIGPVTVEPVPVFHDPDHAKPTIGFRFDHDGRAVGYVPDCRDMPAEAVERLRGVDLMVLDGLRLRPHRTHLTVEQSVALLRKINAPQSYLIHMCHEIDHGPVESGLPPTIRLSYDGLRTEL